MTSVTIHSVSLNLLPGAYRHLLHFEFVMFPDAVFQINALINCLNLLGFTRTKRELGQMGYKVQVAFRNAFLENHPSDHESS